MRAPSPDREAIDLVDGERLRVDARREEDERRLCRLWLQANVASVSRLALDVAGERGIDLRDACEAVVPEMAARWRSVRSGRPFNLRPSLGWSRKGVANRYKRSFDDVLARRALRGGALFGDVYSEEGWTGFAVGASVLEVTGRIGPCWFGSCVGKAWLTLPEGFPETLAAALPGRQLDAIVSHPALAGRGYRISRVDDCGNRMRAMVFATGVVPFEMPWPGMLDALFGR